MSSGRLPWPLLYFFLPLPTLAGQLYTGSLLLALTEAIPTCAQSCVDSFIDNEFPTSICPLPLSLDCLCSKNSKSGFTLGEGSLRCVVATCSAAESSLYHEKAAYGICLVIPNAKSMTHGSLTVTKSPSPTVSISTTRTPSSQRKNSTSSRHSRANTLSSRFATSSSTLVPLHTTLDMTSTTIPSAMSTDSVMSHSVTPHSSTSSSVLSSSTTSTHSSTVASSSPTSLFSAAPPAVPVAKPPPALSKGKIAAIAIGVTFAALAFAGVIFFICRYRRRRSNKRDSGSTFGPGDRIFTSHPSSPRLYHRVAGEIEQINSSRDFTQLESQDEQITPTIAHRSSASLWRNYVQPTSTPEMTIKQVKPESPPSSKRSRIQSTLLPDKPGYSLYPPPLRIKHSASPESPGGSVVPGAAGIGQRSATPLSKASPRGLLSPNASQVSLQGDWSDRHPSASDPFFDSRSDPNLATYARQRDRYPQSEVLTYGRPDPQVLNQPQWAQSSENLRKPVPARQSSSARSLTRQQATKASISPSDYTGRPMFDFPPMPSIPRKPVPRRKTAPRRSATHYSSASETSFEDAGDEDTIQVANAILSPVAESSAMRSNRRQATSPNVSGPRASPSEHRSEPDSPTRKPPRRNQPPRLVTPAAGLRPLKSSLKKPLPKVPEIPERQGDQVSAGMVADGTDGARPKKKPTAKVQILVNPGSQSIENLATPRSGRSSEWPPNMSTRRYA